MTELGPDVDLAQIEGAAQHLASPDYERYVEACESWSIAPAPWPVWWARYGADYRAQIDFAAPAPAVKLAADCGCGFGASCRHTRGGGS